jgi:hypothetical protein
VASTSSKLSFDVFIFCLQNYILFPYWSARMECGLCSNSEGKGIIFFVREILYVSPEHLGLALKLIMWGALMQDPNVLACSLGIIVLLLSLVL